MLSYGFVFIVSLPGVQDAGHASPACISQCIKVYRRGQIKVVFCRYEDTDRKLMLDLRNTGSKEHIIRSIPKKIVFYGGVFG